MCRHLAYLGPPVTLANLVLHQPHSLVRQSFAPTDMRGRGSVNADGFGIGWLVGDPLAGGVARRYRRDRPIWSDQSLADVAESISSAAVLAAVRNASPGMPVSETACAPFVEGAWMFSHNGVVRGWPSSLSALAAGLPPADLMALEAPTDSALLWALVAQQLRSGRSAAAALTRVVDQVLELAPGSQLNLLLNDGHQITATTVGHALSLRQGQGSVTVSSEPLDPHQQWQSVPDLSLVQATPTELSITARNQGWS